MVQTYVLLAVKDFVSQEKTSFFFQ